MADTADKAEKEEFFHPETGEKLSKNAYKKFLKEQAGVGQKKKKSADAAPKEPKEPKAPKAAKPTKAPETIYTDNTPAGEKKDLSLAYPETYQPAYVESAWQSWWETQGFYRPDEADAFTAATYDNLADAAVKIAGERARADAIAAGKSVDEVEELVKAAETAATVPSKRFVMVIPPPNVTGSLHLGHALTTAIEDSLTRWHRMCGRVALWVPGVDHAGIATQTVVERRLGKDEGLTRHDLGREAFLSKVWEWKEKFGNKITTQQRSLGASVDWQREAFTLSPALSEAVVEAFCRFHEDGLVRRDHRLVNWSCALRSALSDIEVDNIDITAYQRINTIPGHSSAAAADKGGYEFGTLTEFSYLVAAEGVEEKLAAEEAVEAAVDISEASIPFGENINLRVAATATTNTSLSAAAAKAAAQNDGTPDGAIAAAAAAAVAHRPWTAADIDTSAGELVVATTRLETLLGDMAVAVHPEDPRYKHLHGRRLLHPFQRRTIAVVTDDTLVDMSFGTGAVKVTPAHDANDFACGRRHQLAPVVILTSSGNMVSGELGGAFSGLPRYDARISMEVALKEVGLFRGKKANPMRLGICSRSGDVIEPMLTPQWYVNCNSMAAAAVEAVKKGDLKLSPPSAVSTWFQWLENIRDWCVSRQLWWGHRIPAYFATTNTEEAAATAGETVAIADMMNDEAYGDRWFVARSQAEASVKAAKALGVAESDIVLRQDEDVLDTWFSSGLFPLSVFGWPNAAPTSTTTSVDTEAGTVTNVDVNADGSTKTTVLNVTEGISTITVVTAEGTNITTICGTSTPTTTTITAADGTVTTTEGTHPLTDGGDFARYFPTSLLETGSDILFFWVARMVMMSMHLTNGKLPFTNVLLHAMVRDKHGRKMSKALGNVIDPLEVISGASLDSLLQKIDEGNLPPREVITAKAAQKVDFPNGIPECGTDALRFGLLAYTAQSRDINLDLARVVGYRQLCNKIWNACRFAGRYLDGFVPLTGMNRQIGHSQHCDRRHRWILSRLNAVTAEINAAMEGYQFSAVTMALHSFFVSDVCDVYLELVKPIFQEVAAALAEATEKAGGDEAAGAAAVAAAASVAGPMAALWERRRVTQATLYTVIETFLRLLHPLMPFVTEELWQRLPSIDQLYPPSVVPSIMLAAYPTASPDFDAPVAESDMNTVIAAVKAARSVRAAYKVANHQKIDFYFRTTDASIASAMAGGADDFCTLARGGSLTEWPFVGAAKAVTAVNGSTTENIPTGLGDAVVDKLVIGEADEQTKELAANATSAVPPAGFSVTVVNDSLTLLVDLSGLVDAEAELRRLGKEVERLTPLIAGYAAKMSAKDYDTKVPANVQASNAEKMAAYEKELTEVNKAIEIFSSMSK